MVDLKRRGLLLGLGALFAAPAIVRVASLMPVSVLKPDFYVPITNLDADGQCVVIGRTRWFYDGNIWQPAPAEMPQWSEALPQPVKFDGYVSAMAEGPVPRNAQDALQSALDQANKRATDAQMACWLKTKPA